ncbi:TPS1 [Symbiodinium natans]|uniref:TPS1 protein n=1 Tax=Symbiodinium natans TaxID=878477 RepID=A0A812IBF0_9DINO|nr:TPS1 [Symbiodinium natans]
MNLGLSLGRSDLGSAVVSNRLPVTLHPDRQPPNDVELSSGGLASALRSCIASYEEALWIGWPGCAPSPEDQKRLTERLGEASASWNCRMIPVWLPQSDVDDFYTGFSNSSLWPLMHWMTPYARFKRAWSDAYRRVNEQFADVILTVATPMDLVWIHDYHLFLVPQMLRKKRDNKLVQAEAEKSGLVQLERPGHLPPLAEGDVRQVKRPEGLPDDVEDSEEPEGRQGLAHSTSETFEESREEPTYSSTPKAERNAFKSCTDRATLLGEDEPPKEDDVSEKSSRDGYPKPAMKKLPRSITQVEMASKLRIAFFLHTPFPGYEVLCVLPQCVDVVEGVLGADLVGFHTYNYLRHFRSCVIRLCGFTPDIDHVDHRGQRTHLGVFPIGANVHDIMDAMKTETFAQHLKEYTEQFQGKSLVLNVERLDYSKGLPQKLAAIQRYLEDAKKTAEDEDAQRTDRTEELQRRIDRLDKHKANRGLATSNLRRIGANVVKMLMGDFERPAAEILELS